MRSKLTNGSALHADKVGDTKSSRRFKDLVEAFSTSLGGWAVLDEVQRQMVRRAATHSIELERLELETARGNEIDHDLYARASGHLRRTLSDLGLIQRPEPEDEQPSEPVPAPEPDPSNLSALSDEEFLALVNQHRRANALLPLTSISDDADARSERRARYTASGFEFMSAFPSPPDPDEQDEEPKSQVPDPALVQAVREILG